MAEIVLEVLDSARLWEGIAMPLTTLEGFFRSEEIRKRGVAGCHHRLIAHALGKQLAHLSDGRTYVTRIVGQQPTEVEDKDDLFRIIVQVRWSLAKPDQAKIGEVVYGPMLHALDKGDDTPRFEAIYKGMRFEPQGTDWVRVPNPDRAREVR